MPRKYLYPSFNFKNRLTGRIGPRGVGNTTILLQYIKDELSGGIPEKLQDFFSFRNYPTRVLLPMRLLPHTTTRLDAFFKRSLSKISSSVRLPTKCTDLLE